MALNSNRSFNPQIIVSAPGKIFLMGEHAVVYGKPALLAAINLRTHVSVKDSHKDFEIDSPERSSYLDYALKYVLDHLKIAKNPKIKIKIYSDFPSGYHIGSSAALAVAVTGALLYFYKKIWHPESINKIAYEIEKKQHVTPSGADNSICTYGGFLWFRNELEFLKSIWQIPLKLPQSLNNFFLINTGKPAESTGEMIEMVRKKYQQQTKLMDFLFNENEIQVKRIAISIKEEDEVGLIEAIRCGERTLEKIGVVSQNIISFIKKIEGVKGAAKILGGGGVKEKVGFLLCYHQDKSLIESLCKKFQFSTLSVNLGEEGIRLEPKK